MTLGPEAFAKASYKNNPEGVLAVAECWDLDLPAAPRSEVVLVLDEIEKPETWVRFYGPPRLLVSRT